MPDLTLLDKLWDPHVVRDYGNGFALLHIDRHLLHDLSGARALLFTEQQGHSVANAELCFATADHAVSTAPGRTGATFPPGAKLLEGLRQRASEYGIRVFDLGEDGHGIVHVMGLELGLTLPGATLICGDSHTCTHGAVGALAFGVGSSELVHALATQTLVQRKPKALRIRFEGVMSQGVTAKDMILHLIGMIGTDAGTGYAVEYAGSSIRAMPVEGRATICNLSIEMGAKIGFVAPDDVTLQYLAGRDFTPKGALWDRAVDHWRSLRSEEDATFDREHVVDVAAIAPQITWGTSPEHVIAVDAVIPNPDRAGDATCGHAWAEALRYQGLEPGKPIEGTRIDWVFIGSCTNSRLSDLQDAAGLLRGRRKAEHVRAWVVPGSERVKRQAEAEGLDRVFREAGFEWREAGCSMCLASNGEQVPPQARCISTSNRNFVGRQGPGARTHLASPAMAAAAAIKGAIADVRKL
ncbi:isopropylmalate isomerase [Afipia sp. P52-10]|uniref:3-isopropylmalate dehydratase large subunit n=1 Tax=Afipia sp. P52-10 TaxID=1429916 RepID=UPI0003DF012A|nr:3-isopropylmalate dehydratase large subunit [Afipia sp. P52-10]ETR78700.1 isopropylmalate isomerase [Afipia sp. P52-10]